MEVSTYLTTGHTYCQVMCDNLEGDPLVREQDPEELETTRPEDHIHSIPVRMVLVTSWVPVER